MAAIKQPLIVVGGGICGLSAARKIAASGRPVTIVEARGRLGGRIHTLRLNSGRYVEAGAEFIHGRLPLTHALLREAKTKARSLVGKLYELKDHQLQETDFFDGNDESFHDLLKSLRKLDHDTTMKAFMDANFPESENRARYERVRKMIEGFDAADMGKVSALAIRDEWVKQDDDEHYRVQDQYAVLIDFLRNETANLGVACMLDTGVQSISWKKGQVSCQTSKGPVFGTAAVITVPLGVLAADDIRFEPAIASHLAAARSLGYGGVIKFHAEFAEPLWLRDGFRKLDDAQFVFTDSAIPTWWTQEPSEPLLTGWLGGPPSMHILRKGESLFNHMIESLSYLLKTSPETIQRELRSWNIADWNNDPWSRGAYSYQSVHSQGARKLLQEPVDETLFFAGEALSNGSAMGTVEAALESAASTADKIMSKRSGY